MVPTREDVHDGHEILGELLLCGTNVLIFDHESRPVPSTYPVDEFEGEAAETVFVGNHNSFDVSSRRGETVWRLISGTCVGSGGGR